MRRTLVGTTGACLIAFFAVWLATPLARDARIGGIDLLWLCAALLSAAASLWASRRSENTHLRRPLILFGVSGLCWAAGQMVWTYEELVRGVAAPMYAVADVGYLLSVVLQGIAIVFWPRDRIRWDLGRVLDFALIGGFATLFGIEFILDPMLAMEMEGIASLYAVLYPLSEILLFGAIVAVFTLVEWHDRARLELAALGLLAICIGDAGYTYLGDAYSTGGLLDPLWTIGLAGVGLAAAAPAEWRSRRSLIGERGRLFAPAASLVVLATAALCLHWADGTGVTAAEVFALLGLIVLLAVRQGHAQVRLGEHVAEQRRLEQQLQHAQKLDAVGRLAGGVAHDFNNLLTAIDGYSELALSQLADGHPVRADVEEVRRAAHRAADLTRQLLTFSRRQVFSPQVVDVNVVVTDAARMLRRLAGESVVLETVLAGEPARVLADPGQLEQVITNLVVNARDAMPDGGTVTVATEVAGDRVRVSVTDTGTGMTEEVKARLFEPFFTTKPFGEGTGLGLAMVHGILAQSNGDISVTSAPRRGSTFEIEFPAAAMPPAEDTPDEPAVLATAGSETVLLVEDEQAVRDLARRMLERAGYSVVTASSGEEALELFGEVGTVDVLVTDVVMPRLNGHELADRLRRSFPTLGVVLMSGYSQDAAALERLRAEGAAFVEKPFTSSVLVAEVRSVLDAA